MTPDEARILFITLEQNLVNIRACFSPESLKQIDSLRQGLTMCLNSGNTIMFRMLFQQLFNIAMYEAQNPQFLTALQPYLRPALGLAGCAWVSIETFSFSMFGMTAMAAVGAVFYYGIMAMAACAVVIFIIWLLVEGVNWLANWKTSRQFTPMQTPEWRNLISAFNHQEYGPAYGFNNNTLPSHIVVA